MIAVKCAGVLFILMDSCFTDTSDLRKRGRGSNEGSKRGQETRRDDHSACDRLHFVSFFHPVI